jgi:cation-transporting ATPase 13A3/4/5
VVAFQVASFFYVTTQSWFVAFVPNEDDVFDSHSNYAVYVISTFQYVGLVVIFSQGAPYRQPIYTNKPLTALICLLTASNVWLAVRPPGFLKHWLGLDLPPKESYKWLLVFGGFLNVIIGFAIELWFVNWLIGRKCLPLVHRAEKSKKKFLAIERDMANDDSWPPAASDLALAGSPT